MASQGDREATSRKYLPLMADQSAIARSPMRCSTAVTSWARVASAESLTTEYSTHSHGPHRPPRRRHTMALGNPRTSVTSGLFNLGETWKKVESSVEAVRGPFQQRKRAYTMEVRDEMLEHVADQTGKVQVDKLLHEGFTTEDLSRVIYDQINTPHLESMPDFLANICLEKKGGLERIGQVWHWHKYFWFLLLMFTGICNIAYLLSTDILTLSYLASVVLRSEGLSGTANFLDERGHVDTAEIIQHLAKHPRMRASILTVSFFVAICEVGWIVLSFRHAMGSLWMFCHDVSEYRQFHSIVQFFQRELPEFSTFSAIKLMATVHPSLIFTEYLQYLANSTYRATNTGQVIITAYFFGIRIIYLFAAFSAFAIKLLAVGMKLINPQRYSLPILAVNVLALMNQCMGCVHLETVLQDRLFLFVFGGQDAWYEDNESAYKNVYECQVAKHIWQLYWTERKQRFKAIVMLSTFDHYDLQRLLLQDTETFEVKFVSAEVAQASLSNPMGGGGAVLNMHERSPSAAPSSGLPSRLPSLEASPRRGLGEPMSAQVYRSRSLEIVRERSHDSLDASFPVAKRAFSRETTTNSDAASSVGMRAVTRALRSEEDALAWSDAV